MLREFETETHADNAAYVAALNILAMIKRDKGIFPEAEKLLERSISIIEQNDPPLPVDLAGVLSNLADLMVITRRFERAEELSGDRWLF